VGYHSIRKFCFYLIIDSQCPKGACLHVHFDSLVDCRWLIKKTYDSHCFMRYIKQNSSLKTDSYKESEDLIHPLVEFQFASLSRHDTLRASGWSTVNENRLSYPSMSDFDNHLYSILTLSKSLQTGTSRVPDSVLWSRFIKTFMSAKGIISYESIFREYVWKILEELYKDNICYAELRLVVDECCLYMDNGSVSSSEHTIQVFSEIVSNFKVAHPEFSGAKIIYCSLKSLDISLVRNQLVCCLELSRKYPGIIVGFDLVGYEDEGHRINDFASEFIWFQQQNGSVPFVFHAGETINYGTDADFNLFDAIALGTKRIGHGLSLLSHPALLHELHTSQTKIAIEICPISNLMLKFAGGGVDLRSHPIWQLINYNIPIVISPDDPAIFGMWMSETSGNHSFNIANVCQSNGIVSFDFIVLMLSQPYLVNLGLLKKFIFDSLEHMLLKPSERKVIVDRWKEKWDEWVLKSLDQIK
jgi:adenosine deaminase CECR1